MKQTTHQMTLPKYGKDVFTTKVTDNLFKILGVFGTFTENYVLLSKINGLSNALREIISDQDKQEVQDP